MEDCARDRARVASVPDRVRRSFSVRRQGKLISLALSYGRGASCNRPEATEETRERRNRSGVDSAGRSGQEARTDSSRRTRLMRRRR